MAHYLRWNLKLFLWMFRDHIHGMTEIVVEFEDQANLGSPIKKASWWCHNCRHCQPHGHVWYQHWGSRFPDSPSNSPKILWARNITIGIEPWCSFQGLDIHSPGPCPFPRPAVIIGASCHLALQPFSNLPSRRNLHCFELLWYSADRYHMSLTTFAS